VTITTTFTASDFNSLNTAIKDIDADAATNTSYTIKVTAGISLGVLEAINLDSGSSVTIEGMNSGGTSAQVETINGQDLERGFFVYSGSVTLENLTLTNMTAGCSSHLAAAPRWSVCNSAVTAPLAAMVARHQVPGSLAVAADLAVLAATPAAAPVTVAVAASA
jgi:hypothetical protein